ncbi:hypothetical protein ETB97_004543 [Aspergillus alliaceus]|uniref:Uncharacterized protein n=1 Tax=Petromyces alliaceus TaxID=209559 RepID=A0A8H6ADT2_PETAA|nr:hypothetical protein ETB97_004543 [Aspergillus burnettii]
MVLHGRDQAASTKHAVVLRSSIGFSGDVGLARSRNVSERAKRNKVVQKYLRRSDYGTIAGVPDEMHVSERQI